MEQPGLSLRQQQMELQFRHVIGTLLLSWFQVSLERQYWMLIGGKRNREGYRF